MLSQLIDQLRSLNRREAEHRTALEFAYEFAAGRKVPPERIAKAIEAAGLSPEDFGRLVEVAGKRAKAREAIAEVPVLEAERELIRKEIDRQNRIMEEAEQAHERAVLPLGVRDRQIGKALMATSQLPGWLMNECPVREIVQALAEARSRRNFIEARLPRLRQLIAQQPLPKGLTPSHGAAETMAFDTERFQRELAELEAEMPMVEASIADLERKAMDA